MLHIAYGMAKIPDVINTPLVMLHRSLMSSILCPYLGMPMDILCQYHVVVVMRVIIENVFHPCPFYAIYGASDVIIIKGSTP